MRSLSVRTLLVSLCVGVVLCSVASFAQTNTTALSGIVQDSSGAFIPNATLTLSNIETGLQFTTTTTNQGDYAFNQIVPGHYTISAHANGFADQMKQIELLVASPQKVNFAMAVGRLETVVVDATPAQVNTSDATLGKPFDHAQIQSLPYLANNVLSLLSLQPGVLSLNPTSAGNQDIRSGIVDGARQDQSNVTLDGVDDNDQNNGYAFTGVLRSTRDSVEEFRVTTTGANADSGRSSGAQVSLVTRSGTNSIHGSAYEYYRDPGTASNDWFYKQSQLKTHQPNIAAKILQNTFGGSLGMPILKNKVFFFGAYEGYKQASNTVVTQIVPYGLRAGTLTYKNTGGTLTTLSPAQIAAMDTKCSANGTCPLGAGTNPAAVSYFNQFPVANSNAVGDGYNTSGYVFAAPAPVSQITNILRLDYSPDSRHQLFVRGNLQSDNTLSTPQFPGVPANTNTYDNSRGIAAGDIWTISPNIVNNARYGWVRQGYAARGATTSDYVVFSAFANLNSTNTSTVFEVPVHNFIDDLTISRGRHTIQVGFNDRLLFDNRYSDVTRYKFSNVTTSYLKAGGIANNIGSSLDATTASQTMPGQGYQPIAASEYTTYNAAVTAVVGLITRSTAYYNFGVQNNSLVALPAGTAPTRHYRSNETEFYIQDSWKLTPRLTLNAGVRYSYLGVPFETHGQEVRPTTSLNEFFNQRVANMAQGISYNQRISFGAAGGANGKPGLWNPDKLDFAPHVSFAYATTDGRSSVRGGFLMAYDHFGEGIINYYDQNGAFGLSTKAQNGLNQLVDTAPRFSSYSSVPTSIIPAVAGAGPLPVTYPDSAGAIYTSVSDKQHTPYAEIVNLSLQHDVAHNLVVTATYIGRFGHHLVTREDLAEPLNLVDPASGVSYFQAMTALDKLFDSGTATANVPTMPYWQDMFPNASITANGVTYKGTQAVYQMVSNKRGNETAVLSGLDTATTASPAGQSYRYFHPQFASLYSQTTIGKSNYHGFQLSLRQMLKRGFQYDFNYTFSKSMDMGSSPERSNANSIINSFDPEANYGPSDFDTRHLITANWVLASPFGRGARYLTNVGTLSDDFVGGWTLTGLVHWSSGLPFSAVESGWATNWAVQSYDVQTGPVVSGGHHHYIASNQTMNAFANPTAAKTNIRLPYPGEAGQRNNYRADGYFSVDPGLSKSIKTFHEQELKLTVEVFNVLNSVRFNTLVTAGANNSYGQYSSLLTPPRQMQFACRYSF